MLLKKLLHHKVFVHPSATQWVVFIHGAGGSSTVWFKQIKAFKDQFNVLLIDLRGHGGSNGWFSGEKIPAYSFDHVTQDIVPVLDHLKIKKAHFVGISLGTIIIRNLYEIAPERVESMIMGGAITRLNIRSRILVRSGNMFKRFVPFMWLYKLFAWIIMPKANHAESRSLFVNEAKKLAQKEFLRWFKLTEEINPLLKYFSERELPIPMLYIMGDQDHLFLPPVRKLVRDHKLSMLKIIEECGHVCNVDAPNIFNEHAIRFIKQLSRPGTQPQLS